MAFNYKNVVPWGRSFEEYRSMFDLTDTDLDKKILGCGDGPASFNALMKRNGRKPVSVDPIYKMSRSEIEKRIQETYQDVIAQTERNKDKFVWKEIPSIEDLGRIRMDAMRIFLEDFEQGKEDNRYIYAELPVLPFSDGEFDLALCSHFLFLYTENLSLEFHIQSVREMCRVAREVRIFPILDMNATISPYLEMVRKNLGQDGFQASVEKVPYEFQKGGNQLLRITKI